jgi:hypothetical protein
VAPCAQSALGGRGVSGSPLEITPRFRQIHVETIPAPTSAQPLVKSQVSPTCGIASHMPAEVGDRPAQ